MAHYEFQVGSFFYEDEPKGMTNTFSLAVPLEFSRLAEARASLEQAIANFSVIMWSIHEHNSVKDLDAIAIQTMRYAKWLQR